MTNKSAFASLVAQSIHGAEVDADRHLAQLGQTLADMAGGRVQAGLGADVGQKGLNYLGLAVSQAIESRKNLTLAHAALARDGQRIGLTWAAAGPFEKMDPDDRTETPVSGRLAQET